MSEPQRLRGRLADGPVIGASYRSRATAGLTDASGAFEYVPGDPVTFSIGKFVLGTVDGAPTITPVELIGGVDGALRDPRVTNLTRLLHSLSIDPDLRDGIAIEDAVRVAFDDAAGEIDLAQPEDTFHECPGVRRLTQALGLRLRSGAEARNHLRRTCLGIKKFTDVAVRVRDGAELMADVFRPLEEGRYPVILRLGVYGRAFEVGSICNEDDRISSEGREDRWFEEDRSHLGSPRRYSENALSPNSTDWVPRGYVCVRVDARGSDRTPGMLRPFSVQESEDYYDAVEWAAVQPWSNGDVGLFGGSYQGTNIWTVAARRPPSLRAIIPWSADADAYRELSHPGGIFIEGIRRSWLGSVLSMNTCASTMAPFIEPLAAHPLDDPSDYGPSGAVMCGGDLSAIEVPFLTSLCMTGGIHSRCGAEAMLVAPSPHKQLVLTDANYYSYMYEDCLELQVAFFEHFLKRTPGAARPGPPVQLAMRTGGGSFEWREDDEWPLAGTTYVELFLVTGGRLVDTAPRSAGAASYSADVLASSPDPTMLSFVSDPLSEDLELAGHFGATLWASATASDMDVFVAVRVLDESGTEVPYALREPASPAPVTWGCLRASQRALDPVRSSVHRPWHTHRQVDRQPLTAPTEIIELEIEVLPATARIPAGHRLRVDVQSVAFEIDPTHRPADHIGTVAGREYVAELHERVEHTIHTGPAHPSRIRLPVVPRKPGVPAR